MFKAVVSRPSLFSAAVPVAIALAAAGFVPQMAAQQIQRSSSHRTSESPLAQTLTGATAELRARMAESRSAITVDVADFDRDGTVDLVTGYAVGSAGALTLQRGNPAATAPTGQDWVAYTQGNLPAPFFATAQTFALPVRPDFLKAADVNGDGSVDVLVAQRGGNTAYLLLGNGKGGFLPAQRISLGGSLNSMTTWRPGDGTSDLIAGVCGDTSCSLQLLKADGTTALSLALPGKPTALSVSPINGGGLDDLLAVAGGSVLLFDGTGIAAGKAKAETLPMQNAVSIAAGNFTYDRRGFRQVAVLDGNGTLHVLSRTGLDESVSSHAEGMARLQAMTRRQPGTPTPQTVKPAGLGWSETETMTHIGPAVSAEIAPVLLRGHIAASGTEDLAIAGAGQFVTVAHSATTGNLRSHAVPAVTQDTTSAPVTSAVLARLTPDARLSTITADGRAQAYISVPSTNKTYTVNTTADGAPLANCSGTCSLRTAISLANADAAANGTSKVDVINIPAGTYTLSYSAGNDVDGNLGYHINVDASVNLVGAGAASTIINANHLDKVFVFNYSTNQPDNSPSGPVGGNYEIFVSGLTMENGTNRNNVNTNGNVDEYGGIADWIFYTSGYLTINNCVISGGTALWGPGGGLVAGNLNGPASGAALEIDNTTISGNATAEHGGGLWVGPDVPMILNNDTFSNNSATYNTNSADPAYGGAGGGLFVLPGGSINASQMTITGTTFSGNKAQGLTSAAGFAGAMYTTAPFTVSGSTFTNNTAPQFGGALDVDLAAGGSTITSSTFTGNTTTTGASYGAAITMEAGTTSTNVLSVSYSRFHGNTSAGTGTAGAIEVVGASGSGGNLTATNNWWGCNGAATGSSCDTGAAVGSGATFTASPYTTLAVTVPASPTGSGTFTATGSMAQNSAGNTYSGSQDNAYANLPATLVVTEHDGTTVTAPATTLSATDTISESVTPSTALTAPGAGTAKVTVDSYTVTANFTLYEADMAVAVSHTGNVNAGSSVTYTISPSNAGNGVSSGTVTVVDTLPSGFTATAMSGSGWSCNVATTTCTTSNTASGGSSFNAITLTASVVNSDIGNYTNSVAVSGGSEIDTGNDTATDTTIVVGAPTISESLSPSTVAPNVNSTVTFTLGNPSGNTISLTGVGFTDTLPTGLVVSTPNGAGGTCSGTLTATAGSGSIVFSGATIASGAACTVTVNVKSSSINSYPNTTGTVTASNGPTGSTATATLTVNVTPTKLVYTTSAPTPITAGGNAGTVAVALEDAAGNVATNNSSTSVTLTVTGPGGYSQTYNATAASGVASFNLSSAALTLPGTYTYTATATSLTQAQTTETVNPGTAVALVVSGLGPFTAPGVAGTATIKAIDSYGNTATGYSGTVHLTSSDATATLPANYTYVSGDLGVHTFSVTLNTAGTQTVSATDTTTLSITGTETGIVVEDAIWVLNANSTLARTDDNGTQTNTAGTSAGTATLGAVAFDNAGNVWVADNAANTVQLYTAKGVSQSVTGAASANINAPTALAIDGGGYIWIVNGNGSVSVLSSASTAVTSNAAYQAGTGNISGPTGIVIDGSGSVWIANTNNSVTQIIGGAAPVVTPTVTGTINNTLGAKP